MLYRKKSFLAYCLGAKGLHGLWSQNEHFPHNSVFVKLIRQAEVFGCGSLYSLTAH